MNTNNNRINSMIEASKRVNELQIKKEPIVEQPEEVKTVEGRLAIAEAFCKNRYILSKIRTNELKIEEKVVDKEPYDREKALRKNVEIISNIRNSK